MLIITEKIENQMLYLPKLQSCCLLNVDLQLHRKLKRMLHYMTALAIIIRGRVVLRELKWPQILALQKIRAVTGTVYSLLLACHSPSDCTIL